MDQMLEYALRIAPGLVLVASLLLLLPRSEPAARTCIHIGLFIIVRDAMTPVGSIRFSHKLFALLDLTVRTLFLVLATTRLERTLSERVVWSSGSELQAIVLGAACALLIAAPGIALAWRSPVAKPLTSAELTALLVFCLIGNAYDELLFERTFEVNVMEGDVGIIALSTGVFEQCGSAARSPRGCCDAGRNCFYAALWVQDGTFVEGRLFVPAICPADAVELDILVSAWPAFR